MIKKQPGQIKTKQNIVNEDADKVFIKKEKRDPNKDLLKEIKDTKSLKTIIEVFEKNPEKLSENDLNVAKEINVRLLNVKAIVRGINEETTKATALAQVDDAANLIANIEDKKIQKIMYETLGHDKDYLTYAATLFAKGGPGEKQAKHFWGAMENMAKTDKEIAENLKQVKVYGELLKNYSAQDLFETNGGQKAIENAKKATENLANKKIDLISFLEDDEDKNDLNTELLEILEIDVDEKSKKKKKTINLDEYKTVVWFQKTYFSEDSKTMTKIKMKSAVQLKEQLDELLSNQPDDKFPVLRKLQEFFEDNFGAEEDTNEEKHE